MSYRAKEAMRMLSAARPISGTKPTTEIEWQILLKASEEFCFVMLIESGFPIHQARLIAHIVNDSDVGKLLFSAALDGGSHD